MIFTRYSTALWILRFSIPIAYEAVISSKYKDFVVLCCVLDAGGFLEPQRVSHREHNRCFAVNFGLGLYVVDGMAVRSHGRRGVTCRGTDTVSWSRGVSVAVVTTILAGRQGIGGLMPGRGIVFFFSLQYSVKNLIWGPFSLLFGGYRRLLARKWSGLCVELSVHSLKCWDEYVEVSLHSFMCLRGVLFS